MPQIWAFSRSRIPRFDNRRARLTVSLEYMEIWSHVPLTFLQRAEQPFLSAGSGTRTRTPFRANAFEASAFAELRHPGNSDNRHPNAMGRLQSNLPPHGTLDG
jgi:hypothetical protein